MKKLLQFIELYLPGANALLIMIIIGSAIMLLKMLVNELLSNRRRWKIRKKARELESNMWAIE